MLKARYVNVTNIRNNEGGKGMRSPMQEQAANPIKDVLVSCKVMVKYVLIFGFILNILALASPLYSMQVLDRVLSSGNTDTLTMLTIAILFAMILQGFIYGARAFASNRMGSWFESKLSETVLKNSIKLSLESRSYAHSQNMRDLQTIKGFIISPYLLTIMDLPWALIFLVVLFILHIKIGFLAVIGGSTLVLIGFIADRAQTKLHEANNENLIKSMRHVEQITRNSEVIEVMGLTKNVIKSWQGTNHKVQTMHSLTQERQIVFTEIIKFIRTTLQLFVTGVGAYLVITDKGNYSSGAIIASSSLMARALAPFEMAINSWKGYVNCRKSYQRLSMGFSLLPKEEEQMSLPAPEGAISLENIYYAHQGTTKHLIKGVNFQIEAGELLAVIGPSASGKTTLAKLIVGGYRPQIGAVRLDGANIKDWRRDELGQYIGYLPQDIELFSGTVKENIARMDPEADPETIIMAAQITGVHNMILELPNAYDTQIGVDGSALSGGQRQRIGLARAFYGEPRILVLDEPNSSLDAQGEAALSMAVEVAKEKKVTTIIISHRTPILKLADKILVMKDGMVAAFGPAKEVLAKMGAGMPLQQ